MTDYNIAWCLNASHNLRECQDTGLHQTKKVCNSRELLVFSLQQLCQKMDCWSCCQCRTPSALRKLCSWESSRDKLRFARQVQMCPDCYLIHKEWEYRCQEKGSDMPLLENISHETSKLFYTAITAKYLKDEVKNIHVIEVQQDDVIQNSR